MSCGIYKITNKINNHAYIGQSIDIHRRWRAHRNYHLNEVEHRPLYKAFEKYGLDNFDFEIIEECEVQNLNEREQFWISYYDTFLNGYNLTEGGDGTLNATVKLTNDEVEEIIDLLKNSTLTQRSIAKVFNVGEDTISEINWGKTRHRCSVDYPIRQYNHKQRICPVCGQWKDKKSSLCHDCKIKANRKNWPSRTELKSLIRTTPFTTIGKQFGVSDNAVRRWCDAYDLPRRARDIKLYDDLEWECL